MITVDGKKYEVLDDLGYQGGQYVKEIKTAEGSRIVTKRSRSAPWRFHIPMVLPRGPVTGQ
jgi:hypothetical protein